MLTCLPCEKYVAFDGEIDLLSGKYLPGFRKYGITVGNEDVWGEMFGGFIK
jgi:hypothetical protein